jgi:hypothetical protein
MMVLMALRLVEQRGTGEQKAASRELFERALKWLLSFNVATVDGPRSTAM